MRKYQLLIDGKLVDGQATSISVLNPSSGDEVGMSPVASREQLDAAVNAARKAHPGWAKKSIEDRKKVLAAIADVLDKNVELIAGVLTEEQGKPLPEAAFEVRGLADTIRYFNTLDLQPEILEDTAERRIEVHYRPLGVVAGITPWNFPVLLLGNKLPPALLAGNTIVLKPAPTTPLSTLLIGELISGVVPAGVVNVIADANNLGDALTSHPQLDKISFTGSTATGKKVMASAATGLKRVTLELGGNDPAIVLDDADPKAVAAGIFAGTFGNSGQICCSIKRAYVHDTVYEAVCAELVALAEKAVVGDGKDPKTQFGPIQNRAQFDKVRKYLDNAQTYGKVVVGGEVLQRPGYFVTPAIVRDIKDGTALVDEEQFGPILPLIRYKSIDDAIASANGLTYGLGASVWSSDVERAYMVASQLVAGTVWVNQHLDLKPATPLPAAKQSGIGIEMSEHGLKDFTQMTVMNVKKARQVVSG